MVRPGDAGSTRRPASEKKDGVDQFGLAARELGHEGDDEFVAAQPITQGVELRCHRRVDQLMGLQKLAQPIQSIDQRIAPTTQGIETAGEGRGH